MSNEFSQHMYNYDKRKASSFSCYHSLRFMNKILTLSLNRLTFVYKVYMCFYDATCMCIGFVLCFGYSINITYAQL